MRIVHTSDWHLGRQFGPYSLQGDQERFVDWFVDTVRARSADLVVIAGDIYDRAVSPVDAIELFRDAVRRLLDTGAAVAVISGNHDGADRLSPYGDLGDSGGFVVRGGYSGVGGVVPLEFPDGPIDLVLLPYLDPVAAPDDFGSGEDPTIAAAPAGDLVERRRRRTHESVLRSAIASAVPGLRAPRSLAVAHAFVTGGTSTESERQLVVGGTGEVPVSLFERFSYTALGHLHRPQQVGGSAVRYSGTPLAYSFSEDHPKSIEVIDLDPSGNVTVETVPVEVGRRVCTISGTIAELLDPDRHRHAHDCFVRAIVTDRETVLDARSRLATVYPWLAELRLTAQITAVDGADAVDVSELDPLDATRRFWAHVEGSPPSAEIDAVLVDALTVAAEGAES